MVAPRAMLAAHLLAQQPHADRIEAAERLVEDEQIRLVDDGADELHALQHALRQVLAARSSRCPRSPTLLEQATARAWRPPRALTPLSCAM